MITCTQHPIFFDEIKALEKNNTWLITDLPPGKKTVCCKWIKHKSDVSIEILKARLVAKGCTQSYDIDYEETFAPVARLNTVLIEAVEIHMPQVIVIDEIGTKLEALPASAIAQCGIQLVVTAHGVTIENLVMNPALEMLVGGVQSVTLGDEKANRRGVQKTVLDRKGPSTISCGVEIISKTELRVHCNLEAIVDAALSGRNPRFEVQKINQGLGSAVEAGLITCNLSETQVQSEIQHVSEMSDITPFSEDVLSQENSGKDMDGLCRFLYGVL